MNNILLSRSAMISVILLMTGSLFAQYQPEPIEPVLLKSANSEKPVLKLDENILLYEDFAGGLPETWSNVDLSDFCGFTHTYQGPQGPLSLGMPPLNSTSSANGFMILDSDLCSSQNPGGISDAFLETPAINIDGHTRIMLRFQHNFRYCCDPATSMIMVEVSNDGETWTSFDVRNGLAPNNVSSNPRLQSIDLSAFAGGPEQLWIRFRKTGASHYWWMIDDVILESFTENDIQISAVEYNHGYTVVPDGQQQAFVPRARVRNAGSLPQTQIVLNATINTFLYKNNSDTIANMASGEEVIMAVQPEFIAPGRGLYNVDFTVSQNETDQDPANNTYPGVFAITDSVYSRSRDFYNPQNFIELSGQGISSVGNWFTIVKEMDATSVSFVLNENSQPGNPLRVKVYKVESNTFTEVAASEEYIITAGDISSNEEFSWVSVGFATPVFMEQGDYVVVVTAEEDGISVAAQNPETQSENHSWIHDDGQWETASMVPMVNLNFGNNIGECAPLYHFLVIDSECGEATGSVEVIPLTGIGPYTYVWETDPEIQGAIIENLAGGQYSVEITDGYGCGVSLEASVGYRGLEVEFESFTAFCGVNGSIELIPANGEGPFTYAWVHDEELNSATATGLIPGIYTVTVTDSNNCQGTIEVEVESIDELPVDIHTTDSYCGFAGGAIQLTPLSGVEPFTYEWDLHPSVSTGMLTELNAGSYSFTVADVNNCLFTGTAVIEDKAYDVEITADAVDASCGLNNGRVSLSMENGETPYTFKWSTGLTDAEVTNMAPGTYTVTVTDKFGCKGTEAIVIETSGTMPAVTWETVNSSGCGGSAGSFVIVQDNPALNYIYSLLEEDGKSIQNWTDQNLLKNEGTFSLENLAAGYYNISVVNEDGCEKIVTVDISDVDGPSIITATDGVKNVSCFGMSDGSITVSLENGGTNPAYQWNDPGESTTANLSDLAAGTYTVKVTNDEGCMGIASFQVKEPGKLLANATLGHLLCAGDSNGSIQLSISGGSLPMSFIWNTGSTTRNISDLQAGVYTVTITDYNYCTFTNNFTIEAPEELKLDYVVENAGEGESNGSISISISGGAGSYDISWDTGQDTASIVDLSAGTYTVTITDDNGCELIESILVEALSISEVRISDPLKLYPNPAKEELYVEIHMDSPGLHVLEIYSITGELVLIHRIDGSENSTELQKINLKGLAPGMYILHARSRKSSWQSKFLKQ
jgi:hypothetical protein